MVSALMVVAMTTVPQVSVVLPVWNGEQYLSEAIGSILAQSFEDFELIVVDDGSTDSTPGIISSFRDSRLHPIRLPHLGLVAALNAGIDQAQAEWIARQDADDVSHPDRLQKQWAAIQRCPTAVLSHTGVDIIEGESKRRLPGVFPKSQAWLALLLCTHNPITHSSVLFKKSAAQSVAGYRGADYPAEDYALWGRLLEVGTIVGTAEPLLTFRIHPSSVSRSNALAQSQQTIDIALSHCCRFMRLSPEEAVRAHRVLTTPPSQRAWNDWLWFMRHCVPRLRWKSAELYAWLGMQTARRLCRLD